VTWLAGTPMSTFPEPGLDDDWIAPRTVA
jgi:hypothetical protein